MKRAICLSGGGSKGSYEIGVWKALRKLHINYHIVTGTSIGALNGAMMTQKSFSKAKKLWSKLEFNQIFDSNLKENSTMKDLISEYGKNMIQNGGMDITNLENLLRKTIHCNKFFHSDIDFGLVTYNVTTLKPNEITKRELTKENLVDYLIASSTCFPAFQKKEIHEEYFIDGGYFDNMPINLAIKLGADEIIAVDLKAIGVKQQIKNKEIPITYITPKNPLAPFLYFDKKEAKKGIRYGYLDTMKVFGKYVGNHYTFKKGQLNKEIKKYYPKMISYLTKELPCEKESTIDQILKNMAYQNILTEEKKHPQMLEIMEGLGKNFNLPKDKVYQTRSFHKSIKKELKKLKQVKQKEIERKIKLNAIKDLLNTRWITLYLYDKIKTCQTDKDKKYLIKLALIMPKEFLKAVYLYTIR